MNNQDKLLQETLNKLNENVSWDYFDKYQDIADEFGVVGESKNMANQIVSAISILIYRWYNDGDTYDNLDGLIGSYNDISSFANWLYTYCPETQEILKSIYDVSGDMSMYENILKGLADTMFNKTILNKYVDKQVEGNIFKCDGPFKNTYLEDEY